MPTVVKSLTCLIFALSCAGSFVAQQRPDGDAHTVLLPTAETRTRVYLFAGSTYVTAAGSYENRASYARSVLDEIKDPAVAMRRRHRRAYALMLKHLKKYKGFSVVERLEEADLALVFYFSFDSPVGYVDSYEQGGPLPATPWPRGTTLMVDRRQEDGPRVVWERYGWAEQSAKEFIRYWKRVSGEK